MAWDEGIQKVPQHETLSQVIEDMEKMEGEITQEQAKILIYRLFKTNPTMACKFLLGVDLFPMQHISMRVMDQIDYIMNVWGRGSGKTFIAAVFIGLYAAMNQGIKIAILSATFRQSKLLLQKLEDIMKENGAAANLFAQCITTSQGSSRQVDIIKRASDQWTMRIGKTEIYAVPLGDGEKLRGLRANVAVIDEFLVMPERIFNEVIMPFLSATKNPVMRKKIKDAEDSLIKAGEMTEDDRYVWPRSKIILLSSAGYQFEYIYKLYNIYYSLITGESIGEDKELQKALQKETEKALKDEATRAIMHFSYEAVPEEQYDQSLIQQALETMSESQFAREFKAKFIDESGGYFKIRKIMDCLEDDDANCIELVGEKGAKYILAIDPNNADSPTSDHFAIQLGKILDDGKSIRLVHSFAMCEGGISNYGKYIHYLMTHFDIESIWIDYAGAAPLLDHCNSSQAFKESGIELKVVEETFDNVEQYQECLINAKNLYSKKDNSIVFLRKFGAGNWIRRANEELSNSIEKRKIRFAKPAINQYYKAAENADIPIQDIVFDKESKEETNMAAKHIEFIDHLYGRIQLTMTETSLIVPSSSDSGSQRFDLPVEVKKETGPNRTRRDSYTALCLLNWGAKIYYDMENCKHVNYWDSGFEPNFIA